MQQLDLGLCQETSLEQLLALLRRESLDNGVTERTAMRAEEATRARFRDEYPCGLPRRGQARVRDYHAAVVRRMVLRRRQGSDGAYRELLRAVTIARELQSGGMHPDAVVGELIARFRIPEHVASRAVRSRPAA
ncbi:MAG: hypothetical protein Kow0067_17970 [Coriobacteriia bacterium]